MASGPNPHELVEQLLASPNRRLQIENPSNNVRAGYRSAMSRAITGGLVPPGESLKHQGRDRGDLTIWLAPTQPASPPPPAVPVPETLQDCHVLVAAWRDNPNQLSDVSPQATDRALRILQALASACASRGHTFDESPHPKSIVRITIGPDHFDLGIHEEHKAVALLDSDQLAATKYDWQRVQSVKQRQPTARLVLTLHTWPEKFWADRKRWMLDQKLSSTISEIEQRAGVQAAQRLDTERQQQQLHQQWAVAVEHARQQAYEQHNRDKLHQLANNYEMATRIRRYVAELAQHLPDRHSKSAAWNWHDWAVSEADRLDPAGQLDQAYWDEPNTISNAELNRFMPNGWSAANPPELEQRQSRRNMSTGVPNS